MRYRSTQGFTLLELLVVIFILAILMGLGVSGLLGIIQRQQLQDDALAAAGALRKAVSLVRQNNTSSTLTISGKTLTLQQGATTVSTLTLNNAPAVNCPAPGCPSGNAFTIAAPFGRNTMDFSLTFTRGSLSRTLWVRGPLGWVNVQ